MFANAIYLSLISDFCQVSENSVRPMYKREGRADEIDHEKTGKKLEQFVYLY